MANKVTEETGGDEAVQAQPVAQQALKALEVPPAISVGDLSALIGAAPVDVIKQLMRRGYMFAINDVLEQEMSTAIARSFGFEVTAPAEQEAATGSMVIANDEEDASKLTPRSPVVTILGHVDHGKTTLLDSVRDSNLVSREAGGITQHIGAYQVGNEGSRITFLDTPGHEAFTAMRARGAQVTDIAVLVVAADDGIMPQTEEAIDHVQAAGVPMIVAINKIDRPQADVERVKRQLAEHDLLIEEWGGDVVAVPVSALTGDGVSDLLENIHVVAEVGDLKANADQAARGVVVEARIDKRKGPVATILVQTGTLHVGDHVVADEVRGRVRALLNDAGERTSSAGPSEPVEVLGLDGLATAGDRFTVADDEKAARAMVEEAEKRRAREGEERSGLTLEELQSRIESGEVKALNLIVKTDVQGSVDAVRHALEALSTEQTKVVLTRCASGSITESDVLLASASGAIIIGFNSDPEPGARAKAAQDGVDIRRYDIIYNLIDEIDSALKGLLEPETRDVIEGYATVRAVFGLGRSQKVGGIYVSNGRIARGDQVHVIRSGTKVFEGQIASLKHFKDDVREVASGLEGGIALDGFQDFQEGDTLEAHRTLPA